MAHAFHGLEPRARNHGRRLFARRERQQRIRRAVNDKRRNPNLPERLRPVSAREDRKQLPLRRLHVERRVLDAVEHPLERLDVAAKGGPREISRISSLASSFVRAGPLGRMIFQIVPSLPRPVAGLPVADESDASERILSG